MDKHSFRSVTLETVAGRLFLTWNDGKGRPIDDGVEPLLAREILCLAQRVQELEGEVEAWSRTASECSDEVGKGHVRIRELETALDSDLARIQELERLLDNRDAVISQQSDSIQRQAAIIREQDEKSSGADLAAVRGRLARLEISRGAIDNRTEAIENHLADLQRRVIVLEMGAGGRVRKI